MDKPKILIGVDNNNWCWTKTMQDMTYCLTDYDCTILSAKKFLQIENYNEYDFVYLRGYANAFIGMKNIAKVPPFISTLTTGGKLIETRMQEMEATAKQGWALIVQNKKAYHRCRKAGYERVYIIPNGIDTSIYYPNPNTIINHTLGSAINTRMDRRELKGSLFILEAVNDLRINYKEASTRNPLNYEQMADFYRSITIYCQPSESEGCSNSVMEAMASGLPCLICDGVGYHGEVCSDGLTNEHGQVVFVKRDKKDIIKKVKKLINNKKLYQRISRNARKFAEEHAWKHIAHKYRVIFNEFLPIARKRKEYRGKIISENMYNPSNGISTSKAVQDYLKACKLPKTTENIIMINNLLRKANEHSIQH